MISPLVQMEDKSAILLLVAGMRKEVQGLISEVSCLCYLI